MLNVKIRKSKNNLYTQLLNFNFEFIKMKAYALFKKDLRSELRTRYAINSLAMFIIVAISVILFSIGQERISPGTYSRIILGCDFL